METLSFALLFALLAMAISNLSDMLTMADLFERPREWFFTTFPRVGKLAICKYCQSWWMAGAASFGLVLWAWPATLNIPLWASIPVCWFALHFAARTLHKLDDGVPFVSQSDTYAAQDQEDSE
jgi:hypothetical protein